MSESDRVTEAGERERERAHAKERKEGWNKQKNGNDKMATKRVGVRPGTGGGGGPERRWGRSMNGTIRPKRKWKQFQRQQRQQRGAKSRVSP